MKTMFATAAVLFGAMTVFTSCNNDENEMPVNDGRVQFTSSIAGEESSQKAGTRAAGAAWTAGDAIGIYMVENGNTTVSMSAANKKFTTATGTSVFSADAANTIYYPQSGAVDFIAYYPYTTPLALDTYNVNVADQTDQPAIDLMWAKATGTVGAGYTKATAAAVPLVFSHKHTKLILQTSAGAGMTAADLQGMAVSINGMYTTNTFNVKTGTFGTAGNLASITPKTITDGVKYEAIVLERTVAAKGDVTVEFTIGSDVFTWKVPAGTQFEAGEEHTWNIAITRTGVTVTATINPWITGTGGADTAE